MYIYVCVCDYMHIEIYGYMNINMRVCYLCAIVFARFWVAAKTVLSDPKMTQGTQWPSTIRTGFSAKDLRPNNVAAKLARCVLLTYTEQILPSGFHLRPAQEIFDLECPAYHAHEEPFAIQCIAMYCNGI